MSETKFTPGPWILEYDADDCEGAFSIKMATAIEDPGCYDTVHSIALYDGLWEEEGEEQFAEAEANAHLIAAAPDLYAALEGAEDALAIHGGFDGTILRVRAALVKARGEA